MKLSIIIPTCDQPRLIRQCLEWLDGYRPTADGDWELIVICNGYDHDETHKAVDTFTAAPAQLKCLRKPMGFAVPSNVGADMASGDVLLFLNNDVVTQAANWAEGMMHVLETEPDVIAISPQGVTTVDHSLEPAEFHPMQNEPDRSARKDDCDYVEAWCMAVRREDFIAAGKFREDRFFWAEDSELCQRLRKLKPGSKCVAMWVGVFHMGGATWHSLGVESGNEAQLKERVMNAENK